MSFEEERNTKREALGNPDKGLPKRKSWLFYLHLLTVKPRWPIKQKIPTTFTFFPSVCHCLSHDRIFLSSCLVPFAWASSKKYIIKKKKKLGCLYRQWRFLMKFWCCALRCSLVNCLYLLLGWLHSRAAWISLAMLLAFHSVMVCLWTCWFPFHFDLFWCTNQDNQAVLFLAKAHFHTSHFPAQNFLLDKNNHC